MQGAKQPQLTSMADDIQRARESRRLREAAAHVAAARVAEEEDRLLEEGQEAAVNSGTIEEPRGDIPLTSMAEYLQRATEEARRQDEAAAHEAAARVAEEEDRLVEEGPDALGADVVCEDDETVGCSRGPIGCGRWKS